MLNGKKCQKIRGWGVLTSGKGNGRIKQGFVKIILSKSTTINARMRMTIDPEEYGYERHKRLQTE